MRSGKRGDRAEGVNQPGRVLWFHADEFGSSKVADPREARPWSDKVRERGKE